MHGRTLATPFALWARAMSICFTVKNRGTLSNYNNNNNNHQKKHALAEKGLLSRLQYFAHGMGGGGVAGGSTGHWFFFCFFKQAGQ